MDPKTKTILFVEDNINVLQALNEFLSDHFMILSATDGVGALDILKTHWKLVDVIITDIRMPNMDGLELIKKTKKDYPDIPVIAMTGYVEETNPAIVEHADVFLKKPFEVPALYDHIVMLIERKQKGRLEK